MQKLRYFLGGIAPLEEDFWVCVLLSQGSDVRLAIRVLPHFRRSSFLRGVRKTMNYSKLRVNLGVSYYVRAKFLRSLHVISKRASH